MSLTLDAVLVAARDQHPAFHRSRVPHGVLARFLSDYQNVLIGQAGASDPFYCAQTATIALAFDGAHAPGTVGPGTSGGLPAALVDEALHVVEQSSGALVTAETEVVVYGPKVVTSATASTLTYSGGDRTTNQDAGKVLVIVDGVGLGQRREILSNTATEWTLDGDWTTTPTTASLFSVVSVEQAVDETQGVVTDLPATAERRGYLVKLSASGVPYIDYTTPLLATVETGVPLPSMTALLGGTVHYTDGDAGPLCVTSFRERYDPARFPAVYQTGEEVRFCGETSDWEDVASLEVRYAPVAPLFTALTDYFLVPDAAKPCLVAKAAAFMALRLAGQSDLGVDAAAYEAKAQDAEARYLQTVRLSGRAQTRRMRGMDG